MTDRLRLSAKEERGIYNLNDTIRDRPGFLPGPLQTETEDLRGFRPLPNGWTVRWPLFFAIDGSTPRPSRLIDSNVLLMISSNPLERAQPNRPPVPHPERTRPASAAP